MERHEIIEHLRISLSAVLNRDISELSQDGDDLLGLGLDSMRFIELLVSLEDTLGLEVDPDSLQPEVFRTVHTLAEYVETRLQHTTVG